MSGKNAKEVDITRETDVTSNLDDLVPMLGAEDPTVPYLVVLAGESVGRVIRLIKNEQMVMGRSRDCDIYMECGNISRNHARFDLDEKGNTTLVDLNSTNGTMVNGKKIKSELLQDGDRLCLGNVILRFSQKDGLEYDFQQNLYDKATKDPLTGAFNKRYFMETLQKEFSFHHRQEQPLTLLMIDLDDFKRINDTYGHVNGDIVLKELSKEIIRSLRSEDILARFGGEEFVCLFRKTTLDAALGIAEKVWSLVREMSFDTTEGSFSVTTTIGVATLWEGNYASADALLMAADQNLYVGKKEGKDRIIG